MQQQHPMPNGPPRRKLRPGEGPCFNCGVEGHWARECPKPPNNNRGSRRPPNMGTGTFNGHFGGRRSFDNDRDRDRDRDRAGGRRSFDDRDRDRDRDRDHRGSYYNYYSRRSRSRSPIRRTHGYTRSRQVSSPLNRSRGARSPSPVRRRSVSPPHKFGRMRSRSMSPYDRRRSPSPLPRGGAPPLSNNTVGSVGGLPLSIPPISGNSSVVGGSLTVSGSGLGGRGGSPSRRRSPPLMSQNRSPPRYNSPGKYSRRSPPRPFSGRKPLRDNYGNEGTIDNDFDKDRDRDRDTYGTYEGSV